MDINWRPTASVGEAPINAGDWRTQLQPDSRERIVNKIMETLKRHLPFSGQEGVLELKKIAVRFEEKIYTAATSQRDYLRRISLKMLTMENNSQNTIPNPLPAIPAGNSNKLSDPAATASHSMQTQVPNPGQSLSIPSLPGNQSQTHQQLLSQNLQNNMAAAGVQGSAGLSSALPSVSGISQTSMASIVSQNNNMHNMSSMPQKVGNAVEQMMPSNVFMNAHRQIPGRQPVTQQQHQQSQNSQYLCQQQQSQNSPSSHSMQTHVPIPGLPLSIPSLPGNQSQANQQLLSQNLQNNMATAGVQVSLLQSQSLIEQQKQLYQSQKALPDTSSTSLDTSVLLPPKESAFSCPICMGPFNEETTTRCGHIFCKKCITSALAVRKECPTCRRRVVAKTLIRVFLPTTD